MLCDDDDFGFFLIFLIPIDSIQPDEGEQLYQSVTESSFIQFRNYFLLQSEISKGSYKFPTTFPY